MNNISNTFYKTFTGSDTMAFAIFPSTKPILLGSLTTLSYSMYRDKQAVPLIGKINTGGYTRGMRTCAGTMIFTLINQHFSKDLIEQIPYLKEHGKMKVDELPMFDIMIIAANEYGAVSEMMIYGVDFIEDGQTLSVQDLYIESTFGFLARDIDEFTSKNPLNSGDRGAGTRNMTVGTIMPYNFDRESYALSKQDLLSSITNTDLRTAQVELKKQGRLFNVTSNYTEECRRAILSYQTDNGLAASGYLDIETYQLLTVKDTQLDSRVHSKYGAPVYADGSMTDVIGILRYGSKVFFEDNEEDYIDISFFGCSAIVRKKDIECFDSDTCEIVKDIDSAFISFEEAIKTNYVIKALEDIELRISASAYYPHGENAYTAHSIQIKKGVVADIALVQVSKCLIYNHTCNSYPKLVKVFLMHGNKVISKTDIRIKGGAS